MPDTKDNTTLVNLAHAFIVVAASWYLLQQLASLLRPLLLAVFLAYIILPVYYRLTKRRIPWIPASVLLAGVSIGMLYLVSLLIYSSVVDLSDELPRLLTHGEKIYNDVNRYVTEHWPWFAGAGPDGDGVSGLETERLRTLTGKVINAATDAVTEAVVVGFYLLFLLLEAHRFPQRVRLGFGNERADQILAVAERINGAISRYLYAKCKVSLILAAPVTLVLWVCGVKFPLFWGVVTFLCNFIPYLGSVVAVSLPLMFTLLDPDTRWPLPAVIGVVATHVTVTYLVEPTITSRAVGLSPLVILFSLAFWGQCWGLIGMFLAVPLTVILKIVLENMEFTRPFAELLGDRLTDDKQFDEKHSGS